LDAPIPTPYLLSERNSWYLHERLVITYSVDDMDPGGIGRKWRHRAHERPHARVGLRRWWRQELTRRDCKAHLLASMKDLRSGMIAMATATISPGSSICGRPTSLT